MRRLMISVVIALSGLLAASAAYTAVRSQSIEQRFPPTGDFIEVDGVRLHYLDLGDNSDRPAVVLVHGASSNLTDMRLALGERLAKRYRVILFDRPGFGWSAAGNGSDLSSPARQARLIGAALGSLGVGEHIMVGHSWAGSLVLSYALDRPEGLVGVLALAPASHPWPGGVSWYYSLTTAPVVGPLFARTVFLPIAERLLDASVENVFAPQSPPAGYARAAAIPLILRPRSFQRNAEDVSALYNSVVQQSRHYGEISVPLTIVAGAEDRTVWPSIHSQALNREVRDVRLVMLDGVGHMPHYARPDVVEEEVDRLAGRRGEDLQSAVP